MYHAVCESHREDEETLFGAACKDILAQGTDPTPSSNPHALGLRNLGASRWPTVRISRFMRSSTVAPLPRRGVRTKPSHAFDRANKENGLHPDQPGHCTGCFRIPFTTVVPSSHPVSCRVAAHHQRSLSVRGRLCFHLRAIAFSHSLSSTAIAVPLPDTMPLSRPHNA